MDPGLKWLKNGHRNGKTAPKMGFWPFFCISSISEARSDLVWMLTMPWIFYPISVYLVLECFGQKWCLNVSPCSIKNAVAHMKTKISKIHFMFLMKWGEIK